VVLLDEVMVWMNVAVAGFLSAAKFNGDGERLTQRAQRHAERARRHREQHRESAMDREFG
jgi:hypothetical protein